MKAVRTLLILVLTVGAVVAPSPASTAPAACADVGLNTYVVTATPRSEIYRIGEIVTLDATVHRKDTGLPVEGARVAVLLDWGEKRAAIFGFSKDYTDAGGNAIVKARLKHKKLTPGFVTTYTYGWKSHVDTAACGDLMEYGTKLEKKAFRVKE